MRWCFDYGGYQRAGLGKNDDITYEKVISLLETFFSWTEI